MTRAIAPWRIPRVLIGLVVAVSAALKLVSPALAIHAITLSPSDLLATHATAVLTAMLLLETGVAWTSLRVPRSLAARAVPLAFVLLLVATRALDLLPTCACFGPLSAQIPRDAVLGALLVCAALDWWVQPQAETAQGRRIDTIVLGSILVGGALVAYATAEVGDDAPAEVVVRELVVRREERTPIVRVVGEVMNVSSSEVTDVRIVPTCPSCVLRSRGVEVPKLAGGRTSAFEIVEDESVDRGSARAGVYLWYVAGRRARRVWVPYPDR